MKKYFVLILSFVGAAAQAFVMGALGDSITAATNADQIGSHWKYSWSTGTSAEQVQSHLLRLRDSLDTPVSYHNFAVPGAKVKHLHFQVAQLVQLQALDYLTIEIGANDICGWGTGEAFDLFEADLRSVLSKIIERFPRVKILVAAIPNMYRLYEVGSQHQCAWKWDSGQICAPLLASSVTPSQRRAFANKLEQLNSRIGEVVQDFEQNVKYSAALGGEAFEWEHISELDCFHPSIKGQRLISGLTWQQGWFQ